MAIFTKEIAVRRTITLPRKVNGKDLLALIEIGGKILNKEVIYELFFKTAYSEVKEKILKAYLARGGTEKDFHKMLSEAEGIVDSKLLAGKNRGVKRTSPK